ncbi:MAG: PKD domain-containing protein [Thermoplasmatota archaeon]
MRSAATILTILSLISTFVILASISGSAQSTEDLTRKDESIGLPQETASFTTVEVFDSDRNGRDEIYLGGSSFDNDQDPGEDNYVKTEGIHAYEYDPDASRWLPFGSGLPGEGSGLAFAAIGLGDVNGDGEMDVAGPVPTRWYLEIEQENSGVYIYSGNGIGTFSFLYKIDLTNPLGQDYHDSSNQVEIVDLDRDGHNDIVVTTYIGIRVFYGDSSGTNWEEQSPPHPTQTEISGVGIGDLNNDGMLDMIGTPYQRSSEVVLYIQESSRVFRTRDFKETSAGFGVQIADLNSDGNNDVVYGTASEGIKVWLGAGRVTLTSFPCTDASEGLPSQGGYWSQVELADVNGDDKPDIISASNSLTTANVFINDLPTGWVEVFTGSNALEIGGEPYGANFGDWDGDGLLDVAGCGWNDGANAWLVSLEGYGIPIADAGEDETMNLGETLRLDGSDSVDRDGDIVEWAWECTTHTTITLSDSETSRPGFTPEEEGVFEFQLTVRDDDDQWSNPDKVTVTVLDPDVNYPPIADAGKDQAVELGDDVHLDGSLSSDIDGVVVNYLWSCTSHTVTFNDQGEPDAWFTPDLVGDYTIRLVVEDEEGASSEPDTVTIHVEQGLVYPTLGPFLYDDGRPIVDASVYLEEGGYLYMEETDENGEVYFRHGIPPGTYSCRVVKDRILLLEGITITVDLKGTVTIGSGEIPRASAPTEVDNMAIWVIISVIVVMIIVAALLSMIIYTKKQGRVTEAVEVAYVQEMGGCPVCGGQLTYMQDFGKYFCPACSRYF